MYGLSKLTATDKHQLLVPVAITSPVTNYNSISSNLVRHLETVSPIWDSSKREMTYLITHETDKVQFNIRVGVHIAFHKIEPVSGTPVIPALHNMAKMVDLILECFEGEMGRPL